MNDGFFQVRLTLPQYPDVPANYHGGKGNAFSFADGHVEKVVWKFSTLKNVPYRKNYTGQSIPTAATDPDWRWLTNRTSRTIVILFSAAEKDLVKKTRPHDLRLEPTFWLRSIDFDVR